MRGFLLESKNPKILKFLLELIRKQILGCFPRSFSWISATFPSEISRFLRKYFHFSDFMGDFFLRFFLIRLFLFFVQILGLSLLETKIILNKIQKKFDIYLTDFCFCIILNNIINYMKELKNG